MVPQTEGRGRGQDGAGMSESPALTAARKFAQHLQQYHRDAQLYQDLAKRGEVRVAWDDRLLERSVIAAQMVSCIEAAERQAALATTDDPRKAAP